MNNGILFIDEIGTMHEDIQYYLLQTIQNRESAIGLSSSLTQNSNSCVRSEKIPCSFSFVCAGNEQTIGKIHPALMSRINSYGLVVYMDEFFDLNFDNLVQYIKFINQQTFKNNLKKLDISASETFCLIGRHITGMPDRLSLKLRHMAGIMMCASDISESEFVETIDIFRAYLLKLPIAEKMEMTKIAEGLKTKNLIVKGQSYHLELRTGKQVEICVVGPTNWMHMTNIVMACILD